MISRLHFRALSLANLEGITLADDNGTAAHMQHHSPIPYTPFPDPLHVRGNLGALTCAFKGQSYLLGIHQLDLSHSIRALGLVVPDPTVTEILPPLPPP